MCEIARRNGYGFSEFPPYTILANPWLSYEDICRIETIGRLLDLFNKHGGFEAAFGILLRSRGFSAILDQMARSACHENLVNLSRRSVFELFARLAGSLTASATVDLLHDALFFDYCRSEMPLMGKLPAFAAGHQKNCSWPAYKSFSEGLLPPPDSRVRAFRCLFRRDYRNEGYKESPVTITFVYMSGSGQGLQIRIV
jgi:anaerobic magnesium-protoporphyrin IX monomethyl ester cyclase